jgi:hypothetical protein
MNDSMYRKVRVKESWYLYDSANNQIDIFGMELEAMKLHDGKFVVFHPKSNSYAWLNAYQVEEIDSILAPSKKGVSISDMIGGNLRSLVVEFK